MEFLLKMQTLQDLNQTIVKYKDHIAIAALAKDDDTGYWRYQKITEESELLSYGLIQAGLKKCECVALIAKNSPDWIIACLAIMRAGAICVPIDSQLSKKQLKRVIEDSGTERVFISSRVSKRIDSLELDNMPQLIILDDKTDDLHWHHIKTHKKHSIENVSPDDIAVIFYTSGTTGPPKGVPLTHSNLMHQIRTLGKLGLVSKNDHILLPLPLHHVYPFTIGLLLPLFLGVRIVFPAGLTGSEMNRALKEEKVTIILGLPRLYRALIEGLEKKLESLIWPVRPGLNCLLKLSRTIYQHLHLHTGRFLLFPLHQQFAPHLKILVSGGAPLARDIAEKLESFGWKVGAGYGLTETSPLLTMIVPGEGHLDSVGKPIEGVSVRIGESEKKSSDIGEVEVKGENVFLGYLNNAKKTSESFTQDGWFKTGDRGKIDDEGFLHLAGRVSTLIVTESGENIQADEVEEAYEEHSAIKEIGILEHEGGLVAVIFPNTTEVKDDVKKSISNALNEKAKDLPSYQKVKSFEITKSALPRTRLGKIRRKKLDELYDELQEKDGEDEKGTMPIEKMSDEDQELFGDDTIKKVWEMLADRYPENYITPDSSLSAELGIDSIEWLNLTIEIQDCCHIEINEEQISDINTVRDLLKLIDDSADSTKEKIDEKKIFEKPLEVLSKEQQRWLKPLNLFMHYLTHVCYKLNRWLFKWYFKLKIEGDNPFKEGKPCIIAPNHVSYLDPLALAAALDNKNLFQTRWAGFAELMLSNPFMRLISRLGRVVPIDLHRGASKNLAFGAATLKQDESLIWFPEGGRSESGELQSFQPGIGMLAAHIDVPIIPVYIKGSYDAMPIGRWFPRRTQIKVCFGKAIKPEQLKKQGEGKKSYQKITNALYQHMKKKED